MFNPCKCKKKKIVKPDMKRKHEFNDQTTKYTYLYCNKHKIKIVLTTISQYTYIEQYLEY